MRRTVSIRHVEEFQKTYVAATLNTPNTSSPLPAPLLTSREIQILREWAVRDSKSKVAEVLFITPATVSTHINRIRLKYAAIGRPANTKAALIARALQDGHIRLEEL